MGGTSWDEAHYVSLTSSRAASSTPTFEYDSDVRAGRVEEKAAPRLDPKMFKSFTRECRDSEAHPVTTPIAIGLDVTGSMAEVPALIQGEMPKLMGLLTRQGFVEGPSICFGGIGDAACDTVPMQIGQFEAGIEVDDDIRALYLEGGGGGNRWESYELYLYFLARMVKADHFEKRGEKGYAIIICDESLNPTISCKQLKKVFNVAEQADLDTVEIAEEVKKNWNLYVIVPNMTSHYDNDTMKVLWKKVLGQNLILLENPSDIATSIATIIGLNEGNTDHDSLVADLATEKVSASTAKSLSRSLSNVGKDRKLSRLTKDTGLTTL